MTLEELKTRAESQGFKYAYGLFKKPVDPPYLVAITRDTTNFMADNHVYEKDVPIELLYVFENKNITEQNKIEDNILFDVGWNKTEEIYLSAENVWQVSYYFYI